MSILLLCDIVLYNNFIRNSNHIVSKEQFSIVHITKIGMKLRCLENILNNILDFFHTIYIITAINKEDNEQYLKPFFENKSNVIHINIPQENRKIIIKNCILEDNLYISKYDEGMINNLVYNTQDKVYENICSIINKIDIVIISDYAKGFLTDNLLFNTIGLCNKNNVITLINPTGSNYSKYMNGHIIKHNIKEATNFFGRNLYTEKDWYEYENKILNVLHIKCVLTTIGKDGMRISYKDASNNIRHIQKNIIPYTIIDVTGCSDNIISAIAIYYIKNNKQLNSYDNLLDILTKICSKAVNYRGCYILNNQNYNEIYNSSYDINKSVFINDLGRKNSINFEEKINILI